MKYTQNKLLLGLIFGLSMILLSGGAAFAQKTAGSAGSSRAAQIITGSDIQQIVETASQFGTASLETDDAGDPLMRGEIDGYSYSAQFYGCDDNGAGCTEMQLVAWWEGTQGLSLEQVMQWNAEQIFGKAYIDFENDLTVEMFVNLRYGIPAATLADYFDWWRVSLNEMGDYI